MRPLTWDALADIYDKTTGGCARIRPMDKVFEWAERHPDKFFVDDDGDIYLRDVALAPNATGDADSR